MRKSALMEARHGSEARKDEGREEESREEETRKESHQEEDGPSQGWCVRAGRVGCYRSQWWRRRLGWSATDSACEVGSVLRAAVARGSGTRGM